MAGADKRVIKLKKALLEIYALAVCFGAIICFVIAAGVGLYALVGVANPEFTLDSWQYDRHLGNDIFWSNGAPPALPFEGKGEKRVRPAEPELTRQREESYRMVIRTEQRNRMQTLVQVVIVLFIDIVLFMIHWRIAKKARLEENRA